MTEKELQKKVATIDKKLATMKLPRGEGSVSWKNKRTCYLEYKKTTIFPDNTTERTTVYAHNLEPLFTLMKDAETKKQEQWKLNHLPTMGSGYKSHDNDTILGDAIKHWFYKFRYLNKRGRTFDREESTLKNQILNFPLFANIELQAITDITVQDHMTEIMKKYSYSTVKKTYELLNQFFSYYYARNINNNPMNTVTKPKEIDVRRVSSYQPMAFFIIYLTNECIYKDFAIGMNCKCTSANYTIKMRTMD